MKRGSGLHKPDSTGGFRHVEGEAGTNNSAAKGSGDEIPTRAMEMLNLEWLSLRLAVFRIDSLRIEAAETIPVKQEVKKPAIRRPSAVTFVAAGDIQHGYPLGLRRRRAGPKWNYPQPGASSKREPAI